MKRLLFLTIYNALLPLFLLVSLPGYLVKMKRRGGFGTGLLERFGIFRKPAGQEPQGGLYVHAVSVGEAFIALKFVRTWVQMHDEPVVLATSTATGHQVVRQAGIPKVRALYAPLDIPGLAERCLSRFKPRTVVLIEAELWPNFAEACYRRQIPMVMLNARLSPRSERRYRKVRGVSALLFSRLSALGAQNEHDKHRFAGIGVREDIISVTGSIKFDVLGDTPSSPREEFRRILDHLSMGRQIVLAASTHAGEEVLVAQAAREAGAFPLIVPRHAERREQVVQDLKAAGFVPLLRTVDPLPDEAQPNLCYVADTTGELRDWTALADVAVIGKSFLAAGGQNPVEAIAAGVPVITGPEMTNFADLVALLEADKAILRGSAQDLPAMIRRVLEQPQESAERAKRARAALQVHSGATRRSVELTERFFH